MGYFSNSRPLGVVHCIGIVRTRVSSSSRLSEVCSGEGPCISAHSASVSLLRLPDGSLPGKKSKSIAQGKGGYLHSNAVHFVGARFAGKKIKA